MSKSQELKSKYEQDLKRSMDRKAELDREVLMITQRILQLQGAIFAMDEVEKDGIKPAIVPASEA